MPIQKERELIVSSSADSTMVEIICKDEKIDPSVFYNFFLTIVYDHQQKTLRFKSLKKFWESGYVFKRYLEYPFVDPLKICEVFEEIQHYLQIGDYVIHFINDEDKREEINIITNITFFDKKIRFLTWQPHGEMTENSMLFKEYYNQYFPYNHVNKRMRFDIFHLVRRKSIKLDRTFFVYTLSVDRLSVFDIIHCLLQKKENIRFSYRVIREWFLVFEKFINWMSCAGFFNENMILLESDRKLFNSDNKKENLKELYRMLIRYNDLLKDVRTVLQGDCK